MIALVIALFLFLGYYGLDYYRTPLEKRFYHPMHGYFKASGIFGHGLGIIGTLLISIGVFGYLHAKKTLRYEKYIRLKYLLEIHIFLCTVGPIMILFHTTFKFGGIISIGFWSMVLVVLSGVIGRFIYIQIPRTLSGRALSLTEIENDLDQSLTDLGLLISPNKRDHFNANNVSGGFQVLEDLKGLRSEIYSSEISKKHKNQALRILRKIQITQYRMKRLTRMQLWFSYWHVFHKPFAIIMLVIVLVHIVVTLLMGYTWIF